jgi:hypothetical protein
VCAFMFALIKRSRAAVILWALSWQRGCSSSHEKKGSR